MFYLMTHSTHFIYGHMENHCYQYMGYSLQLAVRGLLYMPSHRQDSTYMAFVILNENSTMVNTRQGKA